MPLVIKINSKDFFLVNLTCCLHLAKTVSNIKKKFTPKQIDMFKKTIFVHILDVKLVFNGPLCHYILLREVEDERDGVLSFKLLCQKVSFYNTSKDVSFKLTLKAIFLLVYELKEASKQWYLKCNDTITSFGFKENIVDIL